MDTAFLVTDFIIFTAAAVLGFIIGATFVDSAFEKDAEYLAEEVERLTAENAQLFTAIERSVDAYEKLQAEIAHKKSPDYLRKAVKKAWLESMDE